MEKIKNDRFLKALRGEKVDRPPVWMMRQAGRYLPEFMELKNKYDFFTRAQTPELAAEITLQPIRRFPLDASIIFSDILVIPQAMGMDFTMKTGVGPWLENPISSLEMIQQLPEPNLSESLNYVYKAIRLVKKELNQEIPLIGFGGAPWTLFCYSVEGRGSKGFEKAKSFAFAQPEAAHLLLDSFANTTIAYFKEKIKAGVNVIQIFDSWAGVLSKEDYMKFSFPYIQKIVDEISQLVPVIVFAKAAWFALPELSRLPISALGLDWTIQPEWARKNLKRNLTLQGNFDPSMLLTNPSQIKESVHKMIDRFGVQNYVANLGHGILPNVPVENAEAFIQAVVDFKT